MTLATKEADKKVGSGYYCRHDVLDDTDRDHRRSHLLCIVWLDYYLQNPGEDHPNLEWRYRHLWGVDYRYSDDLLVHKTKRDFFCTDDGHSGTHRVLIAQSIGRWGNFMNQEAHGEEVSRAFLEQLFLPGFIIEQMSINGIYYRDLLVRIALHGLTVGF